MVKVFKNVMNNYNRILLTISFLLFSIGILFAQVSFTANAPRQVIQGNKFDVKFILRNAEGENFKEPSLGGVTKIYGPSTSTSYSMQMINGKTTSSSSCEYTIMYKADKAGTYTIPSATVEVDGKRYSTKPLTIEILPPDKNSGANAQGVRVDDINTQSASKPLNPNDLFVRIQLSKSKVYEQEAVVCTIKLYTKYQISQFMTTLQPSFDGFLIEELPTSPSLNDIESYKGENYMVAELKKCILFPQKSGKLTITSGNYDVTAVQYESVRTIFGTIKQPVERSIRMNSNSASVNILPLPEPKPASFTGAVGQFAVKTELKPDKFKTYEAATYIYNISGTGNIKYLKTPVINFPSQFDVYDPQSDVDAKPSGSNVKGTVKFEYTFIPQYEGDYNIPASEFTYFNPESSKYVTLNIPSKNISVAKGVATAAVIDRKDIELRNKDILHIKTGKMNLISEHEIYLSSFTYWLCYIIPVILLLSIVWYYRKSLKEHSNMQLLRTKRANKVAKKRLKMAKSFMSANEESGKFYAEMLKALWGYLSDKLVIPVSELNKENITSELERYGVDTAVIEDVMKVLDKCEFAQYAPELEGHNMQDIYESACEIMDKLENTKRR